MRNDDGRVAALTRFPVKSLLGEQRDVLDVDARGISGDRAWAIRTSENKLGSGKTTRRFAAVPGLLLLRSRTTDAGVHVVLPSGEEHPASDPATADVLSAFLGRPVTVAPEGEVSHFDDGAVSILATASIAALADEVGAEVDPARFRANILLDGLAPFAEDGLVGQQIRIGDVLFDVTMPLTRCVMVDMETADLPAQPGNLVVLGRLHDACLGVIATVAQPGRIRVGDSLTVSAH